MQLFSSGFFPSQVILLLLPPYVHSSPETGIEESKRLLRECSGTVRMVPLNKPGEESIQVLRKGNSVHPHALTKGKKRRPFILLHKGSLSFFSHQQMNNPPLLLTLSSTLNFMNQKENGQRREVM